MGEAHLTTVDVGEKVTATQWNNLVTGMVNVGNHTNDSLTSQIARTAGNTIAVLSNLEADLASLAAEVAGGSTSATAITTSSALQTSSAGSAWSTSHLVEHSVTFANAARMRHFFNGGGKIRVLGDRTGNGGTGGGATTKDTNWTTLLAAVGNLDINSLTSTRSGSGETLTTNGLANGFNDLGTTYTTIIKLSEATSPYTSNYAQVEAKLDAAASGDTATKITVKYSLVDGSADNTYTSGNTDTVDATPDRVGVTRVRLYTLTPDDTQGLAATLSASANAEESNTTNT